MDVTWHDTNLTLAGLDNTWAIWSDQASFVLRFHDRLDFDHVKGWDALRNADNEVHLGLDCLQDSVSGERRRNVDHGGLCIGGCLGFCHRAEDRQAEVLRAGLALVNSTNDLGAIGKCLLSVECTLYFAKSENQKVVGRKICANVTRHETHALVLMDI